MRGEVLEGRYRLVELLGAGGMGEVWRAVDARLDREVAVKVIARSYLADPLLVARFRQEARATARLTSPFIVTVHDHGEAEVDGRPVLFLVMELIVGRPMEAFPSTEELSIRAVVLWGLQICAGLGVAHRAGVVHRDIKPANIMVYGEDETDLKICDFGIARLIEASGPGLTGTGATVGTPAFMSPEQARGEQDIDGRSDLYSLGCLLHVLLCGRPPFDGAGWSVLAQHLNREPKPASSLRTEVPVELDRLVLRLLHKDPRQRPATAEEVSTALLGVLAVLDSASSAAADFARSATAESPRSPHRETPPPRTLQEAPAPQPAAPSPATPAGPVPGVGMPFWNGLLTACLLYAQFALLTGWPVLWTVVVCVVSLCAVFFVSAMGTPADRARIGESKRPPDDDPYGADAVLLGMALFCVVCAVVFLIVWPPSPWWTALLFSIAGGPALYGVGLGVCRLVQAVLPRPKWQTAMGSATGLLNGVVLAGLLAAGQGVPALLAILSGTGAWVLLAPVVTLLLPRTDNSLPRG
ncbi:serine/threonine-protein kinase [Streptomyces sp. NPDC048442]|uniref:serine/threonine-protein kinase n=1 Tax=Streptomyces sp. NPDC048442 TaxID=3154823 RepID=UPI003414DFF2